jgi:hypothetical protein
MFKTLKAAAAALTMTVAIAAAQPAAAFTAPAPGAIAAEAGLATNVSCGGIDCDHVSQRDRGYRGRHRGERRHYRDRRWRGDRRYGRSQDRHWRERRVRRAVGNLIGALVDSRW